MSEQQPTEEPKPATPVGVQAEDKEKNPDETPATPVVSPGSTYTGPMPDDFDSTPKSGG
jgi:hypothetical protein